MNTSNIIKTATALAALVSFTGCASIMSGGRKNVRIESNPPGAHVTVRNTKGMEVASLNTPAVASLNRGTGFFVPANYIATIEKPGYQPVECKIQPYLNPWYFPGNVVAGGLLGLLIIDPATGAMYGLAPSQIHADLVPCKTPAH